MKKNILLLMSLFILAYSASVRASVASNKIKDKSANKWIPKYQKLDNKKNSKEEKTINQDVNQNKIDTSGLNQQQIKLIKRYQGSLKSKSARNQLMKDTLQMTQNAVPVLTRVMKSSSFPENNRWLATFMLGRIMGKKSAPFISKFAAHPHWMLRLASLKVLLALGQKQYKDLYVRALKDKALIVRHQALENINRFELKNLAPYVWGMLYDKSNYKGAQGDRKRTNIIKEIILTMGNLGFDKAKKPMFKMIQNRKYQDIFSELDQSLSKLTKKQSPEGNISAKQYYWSREALKETTI